MKRYRVVGALFVLSMITYIDRACIASAKEPIAAELNLSDSAMGLVFCADIAGKNAGSVSGSMNMLGNLGAFASANAFPYLYGLSGSAAMYFAAVLNAAGALCWLRMRSLAGAVQPQAGVQT
jgi:nitrate/nitrite transporter NarK